MRAEMPTDYEVDEKCAFCDRKVFAQNPDNAYEIIIRDGRYYQAWRVHGTCIGRMWSAMKVKEPRGVRHETTKGETYAT